MAGSAVRAIMGSMRCVLIAAVLLACGSEQRAPTSDPTKILLDAQKACALYTLAPGPKASEVAEACEAVLGLCGDGAGAGGASQ